MNLVSYLRFLWLEVCAVAVNLPAISESENIERMKI